MGNKKPVPPQTRPSTVKATRRQIEAAFTEWERRYRENPDEFMSEQSTRADSAESYGEECAPYFIDIILDVQEAGTK